MGARNRDGSIWLVDGAFTSAIPTSFPSRLRIAELTGRTGGKIDPTPRFPGIWESSGIIDASSIWGPGWFLIDVQAGSLILQREDGTLGDRAVTFEREGGQLLRVKIPGA